LSRYKIFSKPLGFRARFKVPVNRQEEGLGAMAKLANDAHEPVLYILKNKTVNYHLQGALAKPVLSNKS
jgi:hypothetical protein